MHASILERLYAEVRIMFESTRELCVTTEEDVLIRRSSYVNDALGTNRHLAPGAERMVWERLARPRGI